MQRSWLALGLLLVALAGGGWWLLGEPSSAGAAAERDAAAESDALLAGESLLKGGARSGAVGPGEDARSAVDAKPEPDLEAGAKPSPFRVRVVDGGPGRRLSAPRVEFIDASGSVASLGVGDEAPWASAERAPEATLVTQGWRLGEPRWVASESTWVLPLLPLHTFTLFVRDSVTEELVAGLEGELHSYDYRRSDSRDFRIRVDRPEPLVFHGFHYAGRGMVRFYLDGPDYLPTHNSEIPIGLGENEFTDHIHSREFGTTPLTVEVVEAGTGDPIPDVRVTVLRDERDEINHVEMGLSVQPTDRSLQINDYTVWMGLQTTNDQGRVELPVEAPVRYRVALQSERFADLLSDSFQVPLGHPQLKRFVLPASASLFGQITVDPAYAAELDLIQLRGLVLRGASFDYFLKFDEGLNPYEVEGPPESFDRSYSFEGLAPGTYRYLLMGWPDPQGAPLFDIRLKTGEVVLVPGEAQRLDIYADGQTGATSTGVAVRGSWASDFGGRGRGKAVMLLSLDGESVLKSPITRAIAGATGVDEHGRFELRSIQPGRYLLMGQGELEVMEAAEPANSAQLMASAVIDVGLADLEVTLHSGPRTVRFVHTAGDPQPGGKLHVGLGAPDGPAWLNTLLRNLEMGVRRGGEFALHGLPDVRLVSVIEGVETPLDAGREVTVELD
jgi:hypothetical protein